MDATRSATISPVVAGAAARGTSRPRRSAAVRRRPRNAAATTMPSSSVGATGHLPPLRGQSEQANMVGLSGWRQRLLACMHTLY
eukprot:14759385-Heterocapsa_arctica.AAC.1